MANLGGNIFFLTDNDPKKWHTKLVVTLENTTYAFDIRPPEEIKKTRFDSIILGTMLGYESVLTQLDSLGVPLHKIEHIHLRVIIEARINFLKDFAKICKERHISGDVAEVGVYQGEFAKQINACFPDAILFLFDTFEGFDKRDLEFESKDVRELGQGHLDNTSIALVMSKMLHPDNVVIKKGYFPETITGLEKRSFCFVNLDLDLYKPTKDGLDFFYPRMQRGGVILVHDYFGEGLPGVKQAVDEFCKQHNVFVMPIGDTISVAIKH